MAREGGDILDERRREVERLLAEANLLKLRLQFEEAESLCRKVLKIDPNCSEAHEILGDIYRSLGRLEEAMGEYKRAIELDPDNARAQTSLAETSLLLAEQRAEERRLRELAERGPPRRAERSPTLAAIYSLLAPGLGQIYNGDLLKGLALITLLLASASCVGFLLSASAAGLTEGAKRAAYAAVGATFPYQVMRLGRPLTKEEVSLAYRATLEAVESAASLALRARGPKPRSRRLLRRAASSAARAALRAAARGADPRTIEAEARRAALNIIRGELPTTAPSPLALLTGPTRKVVYILAAFIVCLYIYAFFDAVRKAAEAPTA